MTGKERLEKIKEKFNYKRLEEFVDCKPIYPNDLKWLIEQTERVEELEIEVSDWRAEVQKWEQFYEESERRHLVTRELLHLTISENQRYKHALEFYSDEEHYKEELISEAQYDADGVCISNDEYAPPIIYFDKGEKARKVLEAKDD